MNIESGAVVVLGAEAEVPFSSFALSPTEMYLDNGRKPGKRRDKDVISHKEKNYQAATKTNQAVKSGTLLDCLLGYPFSGEAQSEKSPKM